MRGKGGDLLRVCVFVRITPACAGKSLSDITNLVNRWDHPRVCGEKPMYSVPGLEPKGSPPRVRGKALFALAVWYGAGITPACAGKSVQGPDLLSPQKDHPRVCGEKTDKCTQYGIG